MFVPFVRVYFSYLDSKGFKYIQLYTGHRMPKKPVLMTPVELVIANMMARRIQEKWILYQSRKRIRDEEATFRFEVY